MRPWTTYENRSIRYKRYPAAGLPDVLSEGLDVVFCGINPGMQSAALGHHFATRSNRFWHVLHLAGFTPERVLSENACSLLDYCCGLTSAVERPTVCASDLKRSDFVDGSSKLARKIEQFGPRYIAFLGKPACSAIFNQRAIPWGLQPMRFAGAAVWILPNPSGLNRAFTLEGLVSAYHELRVAVRL
jgi:TDG/mug DNA glycosylase family protein